jgi:hypothetical protein
MGVRSTISGMIRCPRAVLVLCAAALTLAAARPAPAAAQATPADSAAVLLQAARAFDSGGEGEVARALYRYITDRFPGTPAAETARERLSVAAVSASGDGATELQVWSTLYGLWTGVAVPGALGAEESPAYGLGLILGGGAGFAAGRSLARSWRPTLGQARAVTLGGTWGTWQGFGWRAVLDIGEDTRCDEFGCHEQDDGTEETFALALAGGLAGIATGALLARNPIANATASAANYGSLYGTWVGVAASVLMDLEGDGVLAGALLGGNAGLAGAALSAPGLGWSVSRWRVVGVASLLGGLAGVGVDLVAQFDDDKVAVAIPLLTSAAGLGVGIATTRDHAPAVGRSPGADAGADRALLQWRDGRLALGAPAPFPTLRLEFRSSGPVRAPALGLPIFHAVF